ncbi:MAG: efflux transporter outer membrane subunit [Azospirillaceae bacterium]|nr:efflux transporter outer membrane subunit [Azospirillaceae bacterium]
MLLAGCALGPDFHPPDAPSGPAMPDLPQATVASDTLAGARQAFAAGRDIAGDWWSAFNSRQIADMVQQALKANPDLASAQATLRQARENLRAETGSYFPTVSATAGPSRQKVLADTNSLYTLYSGSLNVSYTLDVFGGTQRQVEELSATADYQQHELEAAYLSLTANLVTAILTESSMKAQVDETQALIKLYSDALTITRHRFEVGGVSRAEVLQQESSLASEVATLPGLQKQYSQQRNVVAAYLGILPGADHWPTIDLASLKLPGDLPAAVPSKLVRQRPDILANEAQLHEAMAAVGVATANLYPQFTLSASYGRESEDIAKIFTPSGLVWSLAGSMTQTLFDGGTLRAKKRASEAALDVAAANYSSTLNSAFKDVANTLVAIEADARTLMAQQDSERTAAASLSVTRAQFMAGATSYLNLLQSEQTYQSARLNLISAQAARFTDTVALYQSLGGGWWNREDVAPKTDICCGLLP